MKPQRAQRKIKLNSATDYTDSHRFFRNFLNIYSVFSVVNMFMQKRRIS
jgi:hypothetical protein